MHVPVPLAMPVQVYVDRRPVQVFVCFHPHLEASKGLNIDRYEILLSPLSATHRMASGDNILPPSPTPTGGPMVLPYIILPPSPTLTGSSSRLGRIPGARTIISTAPACTTRQPQAIRLSSRPSWSAAVPHSTLPLRHYLVA